MATKTNNFFSKWQRAVGWVIFKKEVNAFFSSLIGYLALILFLTLMGLLVWIFPSTNALDYGEATLKEFFEDAPLVFILLIPAITMRSFAEEFKSGTIELLATRPFSDLQIILGKYFASVFLVFLALLPTLCYYFTMYVLGDSTGIDTGATWGSYIGLLLLGATFVSIGIFASALTSSQIVAFLLSAFLCFFLYISFDFLSNLHIFYAKMDYFIHQIGIRSHYLSISRGVVELSDIIYFFSVISIFILLTKLVLESRKW